jgi:hypothetical protein
MIIEKLAITCDPGHHSSVVVYCSEQIMGQVECDICLGGFIVLAELDIPLDVFVNLITKGIS